MLARSCGQLATARRARDKYLLYQSVLLTGHSRGGAMADFVGRKLGLPCATFNPATWGKVLRGAEEPAARSVTAKTPSDLVSFLETFVPGDRQIVLRLPKNLRALLALPLLAIVCLLAAWLLTRAASAHAVAGLAAATAAAALEGGDADAAAAAVAALVVGGVEAVRLAAWLRRTGTACAVLSVAYLAAGSHPVTHFTVR